MTDIIKFGWRESTDLLYNLVKSILKLCSVIDCGVYSIDCLDFGH